VAAVLAHLLRQERVALEVAATEELAVVLLEAQIQAVEVAVAMGRRVLQAALALSSLKYLTT
jgi:hypothetical protein